MEIKNVDLNSTPLLTNNICKYIFLEAHSLIELEKKIKEYELLLIRALTNTYKLSNLSLDKNRAYTVLPNGIYQSSIFLNFSGIKKAEATNPEETLQCIERLTEMEYKKSKEKGESPKTKCKEKFHQNYIVLPLEIKEGESEVDIISEKQRQILERLVTDNDLTKVEFLMVTKKRNFETKTTTISLKIRYDYREIVEKHNSDELENR